MSTENPKPENTGTLLHIDYYRRAGMMYFQSPMIPGHDPFLLRKLLVVFAGIPGGIVGYWLWDALSGIAVYVCLVTLFDVISHLVLKLRPSRGSNPELLLASEGVTPEEFDAYFEKRFQIRCLSLGVALVCGALTFLFAPDKALEVFCVALIGILGVHFVLKMPCPRLFFHVGCGCIPHQRMPGRISGADFSLSTTGRGPMGPFES